MSTPALVLIIDDDPGVRDLIDDALRLYGGYTTMTASSLREAEEIRQHHGLDAMRLVITDIHLTGSAEQGEGYALYQHWTALNPTLPFVLISGDLRSRSLPAVRSGAVRFLAKPFAVADLLKAVRLSLGGESRPASL